MPNISTFLADKLLDHIDQVNSYTAPTVWVGLYTTNPTMPAGTGGTEVTGGSYARQAASGAFASASAGSATNSTAAITFTQASANWGTVTGVGLFDASTAGNLLAAGPLSASEVVNSGDTFSFPTSDLTLTLS